MVMHKTATAALTTVVALLVIVLASLTPLSARALAEPATTAPAQVLSSDALHAGAVCMTDAECAQWDAQALTAPEYDAAGEPHCEPLEELYDTENPDMGDMGIVCRPLMEV